jgi:hypothetical protein
MERRVAAGSITTDARQSGFAVAVNNGTLPNKMRRRAMQ